MTDTASAAIIHCADCRWWQRRGRDNNYYGEVGDCENRDVKLRVQTVDDPVYSGDFGCIFGEPRESREAVTDED